MPHDAVKMPPHSIESEQALLGALLIDGSAWDAVADVVRDGDFYRDDHRRIFRHIEGLSTKGRQVDVVTVFASIEAADEVDATGGFAYLGEMANNCAGSAMARAYAETVRDKALLRKIQEVADRLSSACTAPGRTPEELASLGQSALVECVERRGIPVTSINAAYADAVGYIESRRGRDWVGLMTGFRDFDRITGGIEPGQLIVIAARPSVGKTAFAGNVADRVSRAGNPVLFFTLEMSSRDIAMRLLSSLTGVSLHMMRQGGGDSGAWSSMVSELVASEKQPLYLDDMPAIDAGYVRAKAKRMARTTGLAMICIDYLGLMRGRGENRVQEIGSISRALKALAKELRVPIMLLAQLNRQVESRADKRPQLSDLRDSGEIEQDADIVAMLHREELYRDDPEWKGRAELLVRKNRNGPLGDVPLLFCGERFAFSDGDGNHPKLRLVGGGKFAG